MAEFGRAVQTALRSTLPLRSATTLRWQPVHSHSLNLNLNLNLAAAPVAPRRRHFSSSPNLRADDDYNGRSNAQPPAYSSGWPRANRQRQEEDYGKPNISAYGRSPRDDFDVLNDDKDFTSGIDLELRDLDNSAAKEHPEPATPSGPPMRLVSRTGRTVSVGRNVDVARGFKLLAIQVAQNRLRQDFQRQKFHERPGLKRKRLRMERWRKKFKKGFKSAVARVLELTRQGW